MAEDPAHPWGSGATRYFFREDVAAVVAKVRTNFPQARANTYICHPWCGWGPVSVDWWGIGGRGDPIPEQLGLRIRAYIMELPGLPNIRHTIFEHWLWTSWGGYSWWAAEDHSGWLRHLHCTYWP